MLQFLHSIPHDAIVIGITLLAIVWCFGTRWCWRFLGNGMLKHPAMRGPIALTIWPVWLLLAFIVSKIGVATALLAACLLAMLLQPGPAAADAVYRDADGGELRFFGDQPCPPEIATHAKEGTRGYYRGGTAIVHGKTSRVCGTPVRAQGLPDIQIHVIFENGHEDIFPYSDFEDEEPAPGA